jgi:hypothetical protein
MNMSEDEVLAYVKAAARAMALPLTEARAQAVAQHLGRTVAIARVVESAALAPHDELAEIFRPAPFPGEDAA